jgi:predicted nucleotidyltransferase
MLTKEQIELMSKRIQEALHPKKIVLFGSYADGRATEDSDIDLLVVAETSLPDAKRYGWVRQLLRDIPAAFDIVVKTPTEYNVSRNTLNHIVYFADRYGKVLYEG